MLVLLEASYSGIHLSFIENKKSDPKRPTLGKEEPPSQSMSPAVSILSPVTPIPFDTSIFPHSNFKRAILAPKMGPKF